MKGTYKAITNPNPINFCGKELSRIDLYSNDITLPFEVEPTKGEHDFNTCNGCAKLQNEIHQQLTERFEGKLVTKPFPFCCSEHHKLIEAKDFSHDSFVGVPEMVARKVIYTNQHIVNNYNSDNWYRKTTDYIERVIDSFGTMPFGCGEPLYLGDFCYRIKSLVEANKLIPTVKKDRILEFIHFRLHPSETLHSDLQVLFSTYEKWLREFPFELKSYFGDLKETYQTNFPLLYGLPEVNIYSGGTKTKMHSKSSLIEVLTELTITLVKQINGLALYNQGNISDAEKIKLDMLLASRKFKIEQGYINNSPDKEYGYRKILKEWFEDEKEFFKDLTSLTTRTSKNLATKPFPDFLDTDNKKLVAERLKEKFYKYKAKQLAILIMCLGEIELLDINEATFKLDPFLESWKEYVNQERLVNESVRVQFNKLQGLKKAKVPNSQRDYQIETKTTLSDIKLIINDL